MQSIDANRHRRMAFWQVAAIGLSKEARLPMAQKDAGARPDMPGPAQTGSSAGRNPAAMGGSWTPMTRNWRLTVDQAQRQTTTQAGDCEHSVLRCVSWPCTFKLLRMATERTAQAVKEDSRTRCYDIATPLWGCVSNWADIPEVARVAFSIHSIGFYPTT